MTPWAIGVGAILLSAVGCHTHTHAPSPPPPIPEVSPEASGPHATAPPLTTRPRTSHRSTHVVWSLDDARTTPATTVPVANTRPVVRVQPPTPQPEPTPHTASNPTPMFFVFGEVAHPGPYKYTGKNRVLDMIAQVQPTRRADPARVLLVTPSPDGGARDVVEINVDRMIRTGDTSNNPVIDEGQVLYVPPHALARIGLTLRAIFKPNATTDHPTPNG